MTICYSLDLFDNHHRGLKTSCQNVLFLNTEFILVLFTILGKRTTIKISWNKVQKRSPNQVITEILPCEAICCMKAPKTAATSCRMALCVSIWTSKFICMIRFISSICIFIAESSADKFSWVLIDIGLGAACGAFLVARCVGTGGVGREVDGNDRINLWTNSPPPTVAARCYENWIWLF